MLMMPHRKDSLAAQRSAERREREDKSPKLCGQVPALSSLRLEIEEQCGAGGIKHTRRVVIGRAPALFLVPCGDSGCDGEHDLTAPVMQALRGRQTTFRGSDGCTGSIGPSPCLRVVHFEGVAEYGAPSRMAAAG